MNGESTMGQIGRYSAWRQAGIWLTGATTCSITQREQMTREPQGRRRASKTELFRGRYTLRLFPTQSKCKATRQNLLVIAEDRRQFIRT